MTPLAPPADQAVRHAVDAYIDGRLLPTFEGEASFETRNSTYRVLDGVLYTAPDHGLLGAELVGWLVEYVARAEVSQTWRPGARAILVDTRNDGVKGPHIIVTSATRGFRKERVPSAPSLPSAGSRATQDGSPVPHRWGQRTGEQRLARNLEPSLPRTVEASHPRHELPALPPIPAAPGSPAWVLHHPAAPLPPPPPVPHDVRQSLAHDLRQSPPPARMPMTLPPPAIPMHFPRVDAAPAHARHLPPTIPPPAMVPMQMKPATLPPPPPPRLLPRALPPPSHNDDFLARRIAATLGAAVVAADDLDDAAPTARDVRRAGAEDFRYPQSIPRETLGTASPNARGRSTSRLSHGASVGGSSREVDAQRSAAAPLPPASVPFLLSRSHQRGVPLR